jgi:cytochrome c oxidase subunit III
MGLKTAVTISELVRKNSPAQHPDIHTPPPFIPGPPQDGDDDGPHGEGPEARRGATLSNASLGMLMFLGAESMFFAGLVVVFLMYRTAHVTWPPPTLPHLPVLVTSLNTVLLLVSALTMRAALQAIRHWQPRQGAWLLLLTAVLGGTFLAIQGSEWVRLVHAGLTLSSGVYGPTFYTLIGSHGLHVLGAVLWVLVVALRAFTVPATPTRHTGVGLCGLYWYYVVALWPILYGLVYLL